jgi:hypothetical protein
MKCAYCKDKFTNENNGDIVSIDKNIFVHSMCLDPYLREQHIIEFYLSVEDINTNKN